MDPLGLVASLLEIYVLLILGRIILSWFPVSPESPVAAVSSFLYSVTEPVLGPVRNLLPSVGMLDLSPLVVILFIQLLAIPLLRS